MEPPSTGDVSVINQTARRVRKATLRRAAEIVLSRRGLIGSSACILITDDRGIQDLNLRFRSLDEATDVLSFPAPEQVPSLGDVAISVEYAERQAILRGVSLTQELAYLTIHGMLHLAGLDDIEEADRTRMVEEMNLSAVEAGFLPDPEWASILKGGPE
jgi:probable rRNA maturation factor